MRNRAKCKKCEGIIESVSLRDTVSCACGEIEVSGGEKLGCASRDWGNFLRIDDLGNVIVPEIKERIAKPSRSDLIAALDDMVERIESMPKNAMVVAINHYDYVTLLMLLSALFKSEEQKP